MVFLGYGLPLSGPDENFDGLKSLHGVVAVIFNNTPADLSPQEAATFIARRNRALLADGVSAILSIDNPAAIEPSHWPAAYARSVVIQPPGTFPPTPPTTPTNQTPQQLRISAEAAAKLFAADPAHPFADILHDGEKGLPLPSFAMHAGLNVTIRSANKDISSPNILAILPGSDPKLAGEYVALSAHLDGYGYGTPVLGDKLYNGALDDAAYVATLIELAKQLHSKAPARSLLFCIFTGEEKGLLGSAYFTAHPTVPPASIVADLNLDQLRPIFPLNILTMEGITDSTLGETVRTVAAQFHIEIRPDLEPERNLFRRADNYNFVRIGVPIASFIFGYDKGSPEEVIYRDWYARRYHKPQDDLETPIDWAAAGKFNRFYTALTLAIANDPTRPHWLDSSPYSSHQHKPQ
jgi:Peptidase family M28